MHEHRHHDLMFDSPTMVTHLELEGEVLAGLTTQATAVLSAQCSRHGVEVRRLLDIGCGPGVGTCNLAQCFSSASVVAVDGSAAMLEHATARVERLGLAPRVTVRRVDLPTGLDELDRADIVWASMVLHHLGDEAAALRQIGGLLEPGGLLVVIERAEPLRVAPEGADLGRPGIWERLDIAWAAWFSDLRAELPGAAPSADYPTMLAAAGFELLGHDVLALDLDAPLDGPARRFAHHHLGGTRVQLERYADAADLRALDVLINEHDDVRDDVQVHATRDLYVSRFLV